MASMTPGNLALTEAKSGDGGEKKIAGAEQ